MNRGWAVLALTAAIVAGACSAVPADGPAPSRAGTEAAAASRSQPTGGAATSTELSTATAAGDGGSVADPSVATDPVGSPATADEETAELDDLRVGETEDALDERSTPVGDEDSDDVDPAPGAATTRDMTAIEELVAEIDELLAQIDADLDGLDGDLAEVADGMDHDEGDI